MSIQKLSVILTFLILANSATGQLNTDFLTDTVQYQFRICKLPVMYSVSLSSGRAAAVSSLAAEPGRKALLHVEGEAGYQHFYRNAESDNLLLINSSADIFSLRMEILYKELHPFSFSFRYNQTRPFQQDDQYELNFGFDDRRYKEIIRNKLVESATRRFQEGKGRLLSSFNEVFRKYQENKQFLESPVYIQDVVQQRLRNAGRVLISQPSVVITAPLFVLQENDIPDSLKGLLASGLRQYQSGLTGERDSLYLLFKSLQDSITLLKSVYDQETDSINHIVSTLSSAGDISDYADKQGMADSLASKRSWANRLMKTNFRFGKFILNNSELTVSNIFLHGASIKYGDRNFVMVSGGFYDFAFRNFFNFRTDSSRQKRPAVLAVKFGRLKGKNLTAASFFVGQKERPGSVSGLYKTIAGVSFEKNLTVSKNIFAELEIAKSTTGSDRISDKQRATLKDLFTSYNVKTIGAFATLNGYFPKTKTDATIAYRYWGQQFESFNANQYFNPQNYLAVNLSQSLLKRKLFIQGGVKYTDFKSYGISSNIKSKTLFANASATLRIRRLPVISVGYYPGSQLYWLDQSRLYEYYYYILNSTVSHYFKAGTIPVQAVFSYNQFSNKYTDSLVAGSQSNYSLFLTTWIHQFSFQANYTRQQAGNSQLTTGEAGLIFSNRLLRIGGTFKLNFAELEYRTGYSVNLGISMKRAGTLSVIYDKSYLPDRAGQFIPVTMGQLQLTKPLKFNVWQKG